MLALIALVSGSLAAADIRAPSFSSEGLVSAATGQAVLAPYTVCSLYGTDLFFNGTAASTARGAVPFSLAGVSVLLGSFRAGVFFVSANQINLLIPSGVPPGTYDLTVTRDGIASQAAAVVVQEVAPGLFASTPGFIAAGHADGSAVTADSPAVPGEVIVLYATGLGQTNPNPADRSYAASMAQIVHLADFQLTLDGLAIDPASVQYVGLTPGNAGLYQINVRLPDDLSPANPEIRISVAGSWSPPGLRLITGAYLPN